MVGIYFSGTGNTKHCLKCFVKFMGESCDMVSIEDKDAISAMDSEETIIFAYPIYYSNLPKIVRDFIVNNESHFRGKKIYIISTMGLFSGDGSGCASRLLKKYGAEILGATHVKMPDCIGDVKLLKKENHENVQIIKNAEEKLRIHAEKFKQGNASQEGLGFVYHMCGLFGQRLWFYSKTQNYTDKLKISKDRCKGCGLCVKACPMKNISISEGKARAEDKCTMCYRCVNRCPEKAITLIGKEVFQQCTIEKYL